MIATAGMRRQRSNTQKVSSVSIPAPVGGWNARDGLGDMAQTDAVTLVNMFPAATSVNVRKGYTQHVTGITGQVESLMAYSSGTADKMFGAAGTSIYDVSSAGAVGAAVVTSLTNARWQYANFTTTGGSYLVMVNGADVYQVYTGSAWHKDGDGAPYDITNVTSSNLTNVVAFKNRLWFTEKNNLKAWYLPINAIGGAATALDMSSIAQQGGYLMAAMVWTIDGGYGMDDYLVFITSNGEVMVWRLTDPTSPTGIALTGVWALGSPVGRRCWIKNGGDLLIITRDGVVNMSSALQSARGNPKVNLTDKIQNAMRAAIENYSATFGWQLFSFPQQAQLYLNVPVAAGSQQQYVRNEITGAWCSFTGWAANCFELFGDNAYFGGNGVVCKAWNGTTDDSTQINATAVQSFQPYGGARQKQCKMIRFHFLADGTPSVYGDVNVDYDTTTTNLPGVTMGTPTTSLWDAAVWDASLWGADLTPLAEWQGSTGIGWTFAPTMKAATNGIQLQWASTDLVFEAGGVL